MEDNDYKTVIVIGGGGVGLAITKKFLREKFRVFLLSKGQGADAAEAGCEFISCDVTDPERIVSALKTVVQKANTADCLVFTAVTPPVQKTIEAMSLAEFKAHFEVEVFGGFSVFKAAAEIMKRQGFGSIVGISTVYTEPQIQHPPLAGYMAAKYALKGLLRELAAELMPFNVRVNAVAPSFMDAGLNRGVHPRMKEFIQEKNPMGRLVTPEEVAETVFFLCSEASKPITGQHISLSNGEAMNL